MNKPENLPTDSIAAAFPIDRVDLIEAHEVLIGLNAHCMFDVTGSESDGHLVALKIRAIAAARTATGNSAIQLESPMREDEVLGRGSNGTFICWDAQQQEPYNSGDTVEDFAIRSLTLREARRVGVEPNAWIRAMTGPMSRVIYIEAHDTSAYGGVDGPSFAMVRGSSDLAARLLHLQALCVEHELTEVRVFAAPDRWGGCDESAMRFSAPELVVTPTSFWFSDRPKGQDYEVETRSQQINQLLALLSEPMTTPLFLGTDVQRLADLIAEEAEEPEILATEGAAGGVPHDR